MTRAHLNSVYALVYTRGIQGGPLRVTAEPPHEFLQPSVVFTLHRRVSGACVC